MDNTLDKAKGIQADLKDKNMLNDDMLDQVTGGISPLESAIKGVTGFANAFSYFIKKSSS